MLDPLEVIANLLIKYYSPIGNIEHKYKTKVTAIGLLKSVNISKQEFLNPYYERLKSYKGLVQNLMDNFKMTNIVALKIFSEIVFRIRNEESIPESERWKSDQFLSLIILLYPALGEGDSVQFLATAKKLYSSLVASEACEKVAATVIDKYLTTQTKYDQLAERIVKKCLTGVKQEAVLRQLEAANYIFFVYAYFDPRKKELRYEITYKHAKNIEQLEPFYNIKMMARAIVSLVNQNRTIINFFGEHIKEYDEIRSLFSKHPWITIFFF